MTINIIHFNWDLSLKSEEISRFNVISCHNTNLGHEKGGEIQHCYYSICTTRYLFVLLHDKATSVAMRVRFSVTPIINHWVIIHNYTTRQLHYNCLVRQSQCVCSKYFLFDRFVMFLSIFNERLTHKMLWIRTFIVYN